MVKNVKDIPINSVIYRWFSRCQPKIDNKSVWSNRKDPALS